MATRAFQVGTVEVGGKELFLIAGPCVLESEALVLKTAERLRNLSATYGLPLIFKSSYKKANRTSIHSYTGPGLEEGLRLLEKVGRQVGLPVLSDVHGPEEVKPAAEVLDALQIPAFLCRQTDLLVAAGATRRPINVKKGPFLAPEDMRHVVEKIRSQGNEKILLTERGTTFGYHNLVVDMRALLIMAELGYPVVLDATHSLQRPGGAGDRSGGEPRFVGPLARAGVAVGCHGIFLETHPNPTRALSDGASMLPLEALPGILEDLRQLQELAVRWREGPTG